jgi:ABC-2 type transport system ATP-binding protein
MSQTVSALREELQSGTGRGVTQLAELASRHANNRELVYRAVLLKRELSRTQDAPSREQIAQSLEILDALIADQAGAIESDQTRHAIAEAARSRAMAIDVPNAVVLHCTNIRKTYRRGDFALDKISFEIRYGEIVGVVGRNGNGKTTLFRVLVGELRPDTGALQFPAIDARGASPRWSRVREHIAYVPQDLPSWSGSLRSNLHYEAAFHGVRGADNEREVDYIVERLGLTNELDQRWHELSGGYKLRFALARALVWKPKLVILDEPLANLDFMS